MNNPLMRKGEFARHRGVKPSAVSNWNKRGLLVFAEGPGGQLLVDVVKTEARLNANVDTTRGRPSGGTAAAAGAPAAPQEPADAPGGGAAIANPRIDLVRQQVIEKTLKNRRDAGELVVLAEYERRAAEMGRQSRERVMSAIRGLAERLATETDPRQIITLCEGEIDRIFNDLAADIEQGALSADDDADADSVADEEEASGEEAA